MYTGWKRSQTCQLEIWTTWIVLASKSGNGDGTTSKSTSDIIKELHLPNQPIINNLSVWLIAVWVVKNSELLIYSALGFGSVWHRWNWLIFDLKRLSHNSHTRHLTLSIANTNTSYVKFYSLVYGKCKGWHSIKNNNNEIQKVWLNKH